MISYVLYLMFLIMNLYFYGRILEENLETFIVKHTVQEQLLYTIPKPVDMDCIYCSVSVTMTTNSTCPQCHQVADNGHVF